MITSRGGTRRWLAFGAVILAETAVGLDLTVLSVALPTLSGALHASESDLQWFSSGYALVLAAAMLPAGLLGDRYGRKKVILASLALFAAGSLACAYSRTAGEFIAARVLLGLAGAGLTVMAVSALAVLFSEAERPKAVRVWAAANMVAFPAGPILGGWLLSHFWWGWVFLMNVPVAVLGLVAVALFVPESSSAQRPGLDVIGIGTSSGGLVALTYGLIEAGQYGWRSPVALGWILAGLAVLVGFFRWERALVRRGGQPVLDLALFRSAAFTWGAVLVPVLFLALTGLLFTMPQYFQGVLGTSAQGSGIRLLPVLGGMMAGLASAEAIARKVGAKLAIAAGFTVLGAGLGLGAATTAASGEAFVATWMAIAGVGAGLTMATATTAALAELSADRAGVGSGVQQALRNVGAPLGSAVLGSALTSAYVSHLDPAGLSPAAAHAARQSVFGGVAVARTLRSAPLLASVRAAFVHGMDVALLVSLGFAIAGVVLALIFMPGRVGGSVAQPEASPSRPNSSSSSAGISAADVAPPKT
jgi:DHA2 family multidrug resistance protein-like MFS transporter